MQTALALSWLLLFLVDHTHGKRAGENDTNTKSTLHVSSDEVVSGFRVEYWKSLELKGQSNADALAPEKFLEESQLPQGRQTQRSESSTVPFENSSGAPGSQQVQDSKASELSLVPHENASLLGQHTHDSEASIVSFVQMENESPQEGQANDAEASAVSVLEKLGQSPHGHQTVTSLSFGVPAVPNFWHVDHQPKDSEISAFSFIGKEVKRQQRQQTIGTNVSLADNEKKVLGLESAQDALGVRVEMHTNVDAKAQAYSRAHDIAQGDLVQAANLVHQEFKHGPAAKDDVDDSQEKVWLGVVIGFPLVVGVGCLVSFVACKPRNYDYDTAE